MSYIIIKIIAIVTMLIDHVGAILMPYNLELRTIGRISFPLFCFLIVNGFHYTKDKKKYLMRMGLFALISEIPYDLAFYHKINFSSQNVFLTLFLGLLLIIICDKIKENKKLNKYRHIVQLLPLGIISFVSTITSADYKWYGILLIFLLYKTYGNKIKNKILMSSMIILMGVLYFLINNLDGQLIAAISSVFIFLFEDKKVTVNKWIKIAMYIFYPLHLTILFILSII